MQKILIVDDDARMRRMLRELVGGLASTVYEAADGAEAVAVFAAERPELVLMDLHMKTLDGLRATARIKARFPDARVAIVTQYDEPELRNEAARAGAFTYVLKDNLKDLPALFSGGRAAPKGEQGGAARAPSAEPE